jgi:hypothetical protein
VDLPHEPAIGLESHIFKRNLYSFYCALAFLNGGFFLAHGLWNSNDWLAIAGLLLAGWSLAGALDLWRERTVELKVLNEAKLPNLDFLDSEKRAIVITDLGESEISPTHLEQFARGEIELDYWIAKRTIAGNDTLIIPAFAMKVRPQETRQAMQRLQEKYERVIWMVSDEVTEAVISEQP